MRKILHIGGMVFLFILSTTLLDDQCCAKIYKYKDENGNWCFSDVPDKAPNIQDVEQVPEYTKHKRNLGAKIAVSFSPKNKIEQARNATVMVLNPKGGYGSGFFITDDGYILTNKHVVKDEQSIFKIILIDKTEFTIYGAEISYDYDLALLKLSGHKCPFIEPGDPKQVGDGVPVWAIGMPKGMMHTVTNGIFSGLRKLKGITHIQTNAQINPGNSGGPLITEDGKVIGINTAKMVEEAVEGIGFAIPISTALDEFSSSLGQYYQLE
jgi:S1-C subfamily serine protease